MPCFFPANSAQTLMTPIGIFLSKTSTLVACWRPPSCSHFHPLIAPYPQPCRQPAEVAANDNIDRRTNVVTCLLKVARYYVLRSRKSSQRTNGTAHRKETCFLG